ncbi:hypothetical protein [Actinomadura nitritigenes]|uniref:hypothetical protein n=1 Tax=Actinomadura nitritigenes TaxID=134602 RepID=UPI003D929386
MRESNGLLTVAFRRSYVPEAIINYGSTVADRASRTIRDYWDTSIWSHVEPAMAFQMGLPILILRESGVIANGMLETGVVGTYMPEFSLDSPPEGYFSSQEWRHLIQKWEMQVNTVVERKGQPPQLY